MDSHNNNKRRYSHYTKGRNKYTVADSWAWKGRNILLPCTGNFMAQVLQEISRGRKQLEILMLCFFILGYVAEIYQNTTTSLELCTSMSFHRNQTLGKGCNLQASSLQKFTTIMPKMATSMYWCHHTSATIEYLGLNAGFKYSRMTAIGTGDFIIE